MRSDILKIVFHLRYAMRFIGVDRRARPGGEGEEGAGVHRGGPAGQANYLHQEASLAQAPPGYG